MISGYGKKGTWRNIWWRLRYPGVEWFDIVNEEGQKTGKAPRPVCHSGRPGYLHPVVHLHVILPGDRLVLQKRSLDKKIQPGKWDTAVGGHLSTGEKIIDALYREAEEEIGLTGFTPIPLGRYPWESEVETELVYLFYVRCDPTLRPQVSEVDELRAWEITLLNRILPDDRFTPNFMHEFNLLREVLVK